MVTEETDQKLRRDDIMPMNLVIEGRLSYLDWKKEVSL